MLAGSPCTAPDSRVAPGLCLGLPAPRSRCACGVCLGALGAAGSLRAASINCLLCPVSSRDFEHVGDRPQQTRPGAKSLEEGPPVCKESFISARSRVNSIPPVETGKSPFRSGLSHAVQSARWGHRTVLRAGELGFVALMCLCACLLSGLCGRPDKESRRHDEPHELGVRHSGEERGKRGFSYRSCSYLRPACPMSAPQALAPSPWGGRGRVTCDAPSPAPWALVIEKGEPGCGEGWMPHPHQAWGPERAAFLGQEEL